MDKKSSQEPHKLSEKVIKLSQVITAATVIISAFTALYAALDNRFVNKVSGQIEELRTEVADNNRQTDLQLTRLELLSLIHDQPSNKMEIEKVAMHYFVDLEGDWYVSSIYSEWAEEHDGDVSFIKDKSQ